MEISDIALRVVGAFYAFAGVVATRAAIMSAFLDMAIAKISLKRTSRREALRTYWLLGAAALIFLGGAALAVQIDLAQWLFVISALGQAVYLAALAPLYFDAEDPPDAAGRQSTLNAFVLYLAATAFVLWGAAHGKLKPVSEASPAAIAIFGTLLAAYIWYLGSTAWKTLRPSPQTTGGVDSDDFDSASGPIPFDASVVAKVKVMADYGCDPLWSLDDNYWNFSGADLGLSPDLARDLADWADRYDKSLNPDDPQNSDWSDADFLRHSDEGRALAVRLKRERPDLMVYAWEAAAGVVEVH
jgi:hypothetical protein